MKKQGLKGKYKIKEATVESIVLAARNTFPNEFIALLGADKEKGVIDELVVVPAVYGKRYTLIKTYLIPFDSRIVGSVHSHPSPNASPSKGDLASFPKMGEIHIIISHPFDLNTMKAFDSKGNALELEVVP